MSGTTPPAGRWLVLYDADCGLCKWLLAGLLRWDRGRRLRPVRLDGEEAERLLGDLDPEARMASWHLVEPGGRRHSAGDALAPLAEVLPGGRLPSAVLARVPGMTGPGYRWVADNRGRLSALVPARSKERAAAEVAKREQR